GIYELNGDTLKVCSVAGTWKEKQWTGKRRPTAGWVPFEPDRDAERKRQEQLYLDATAKWLTSMSPVSATAGVLSGSAVLPATVADGILERVRAGKPDLIVMATHGRGPLGRFMRGSVADELIRRSRVPVLLVRP